MMYRLAWIAVLSCAIPTTASATLSPSRTAKTDSELFRWSKLEPAGGKVKPATPEFTMTPETEVLLDGKPCAYKAIPAGASVSRIEVGEDRKTILRIEFTSGK